MGKALKVPKDVRKDVNALWTTDKEQAAKQIAIWLLDVIGLGNHDDDTGLNVSIQIGTLLEMHKHDSAEEFIKAVLKKFRNM